MILSTNYNIKPMTNHFLKPLKFFSVLLVGILLYGGAFAQRITGKVQDENGAGLPYANVLLLSASDSSLVKGTVTDTTGAYALERIASGDYTLSVQMIGYTSYFTDNFTFDGAAKSFPAVKLEEATTELGEVVVSAAKPLIEVTPNAMVINVESSPILKNGTAYDVLEKSPGVVIDQNGNLSVKGKSNVLVYMDGKPTYMSSTDLMRLLQSTPAENIEKLEIMDNPPAKYEAEGNAGIINIVRTKEAATGLNGSVSLNTGYGRYPKISPNIDLNYRQEKFNVFGNYGYFYNKRYRSNTIFRRLPYVGEQEVDETEAFTIFDLSSSMTPIVKGQNFRAGLDYFLTPKTTIGVLLSGNYGSWGGEEISETVLGGVYDNPYDRLTAVNNQLQKWNNITYNANIKQDLGKGGELILDADYALRHSPSKQNNNNYYFSDEGPSTEPPLLVRTQTQTDISILAMKADYNVSVFKDWGLEAGWKTSIVKTDNDFNFSVFNDGDYRRDSLRSNRFQYDEHINAGYVNVKKKWNDHWQMEAGLRGEHTYSMGNSITLDSVVQRNYFNLFPSTSMSYTPSDQHSVSLSYSRRIDRPNYGNLNPFEYFLDPFTFSRGNPFLNPQYTNAVALTYGLKQAMYITLNYANTQDNITEVLKQDEAAQKTYQTTENLARVKNYSVNVTTPLPLKNWWMLNLNLTGFYNDILSPFSEGGQINKSQFSYTANVRNTITLPKDIKYEISGFYRSAMLWGIFEINPQYQIDMGISKKMGKFNIQASVDDVFNIRKNVVFIQQGDIDTFVHNKWESRVFRLNISYRFGNDKIQGARKRNTASDDLQQRASD